MNIAHVIVGPVVTEKAETQKAAHNMYTIKVAPKATKVDIKSALQHLYDVEVDHVHIMRVGGKTRLVGRTRKFTKRHPYKKAIVKLAPSSKPLDLTVAK